MQQKIIGGCLSIVKKNIPQYDDTKIEEIEYGLISIYLTITKMFIIALSALLLGILKEMMIFLIIYNIVRSTSFGLHATKSWICLLSSLAIFIIVPYLCTNIEIATTFKILIGIITTILIFKNSPADTEKKPIINLKRRTIYKTISTIIAITYFVLALTLKSNFLINCLLFSLIIQSFIISPKVYKLFGLPYDNYKTYQKEN